MTSNITNEASLTVNSSSSNRSLTDVSKLFLLFIGLCIATLFLMALIDLKIGAMAIAAILAGGLLNTLYTVQQISFELELEEDLMEEIIEDLQNRND